MQIKLHDTEPKLLGVINENQHVLFVRDTNISQYSIMLQSGVGTLVTESLEEILNQSKNLAERRGLYEGDSITITL